MSFLKGTKEAEVRTNQTEERQNAVLHIMGPKIGRIDPDRLIYLAENRRDMVLSYYGHQIKRIECTAARDVGTILLSIYTQELTMPEILEIQHYAESCLEISLLQSALNLAFPQ